MDRWLTELLDFTEHYLLPITTAILTDSIDALSCGPQPRIQIITTLPHNLSTINVKPAVNLEAV
jgi:hypothetical protein